MNIENLSNEERFRITIQIDKNLSQIAEELWMELPDKFSRQTIHDLIIKKFGHVGGGQAEKISEYYELHKGDKIQAANSSALFGPIYKKC